MSERNKEAENNEHINAQQDECDSMAIIFEEDFVLISNDPIYYSITLRSENDGDADGAPIDHDLALAVSYPALYPDVPPTFRLIGTPLHPVQERALLDVAYDVAQTGSPCVYGCVIAVRDFLNRGGLVQAGISLLSDDCLARILSYLATTPEDVKNVCTAMPVFTGASMSNAVWKPLCRRRWMGKWGVNDRWKRYKCRVDDDKEFWKTAYAAEEKDATRTSIHRNELCSMTFECRAWFSKRRFRNQPDGMRDVLPSGLSENLASDVVFATTNEVSSDHRNFELCTWEIIGCNGCCISRLAWKIRRETEKLLVDRFTVHRTDNWGWELRGFFYVLRAKECGASVSEIELWRDIMRNIVVQEKPRWVSATRFHKYYYREVPDDMQGLGW
jgi:hypothetical protein